jgi:hypothetical protein
VFIYRSFIEEDILEPTARGGIFRFSCPSTIKSIFIAHWPTHPTHLYSSPYPIMSTQLNPAVAVGQPAQPAHTPLILPLPGGIKVVLKGYWIRRALASARTLCPFPEYCPVFHKGLAIVSEGSGHITYRYPKVIRISEKRIRLIPN